MSNCPKCKIPIMGDGCGCFEGGDPERIAAWERGFTAGADYLQRLQKLFPEAEVTPMHAFVHWLRYGEDLEDAIRELKDRQGKTND